MAEAGGKQFGKYRAVREISQAGASTIYAAGTEGSADATVAIKVLRVPDFLSPAEAKRRVDAFLARAASHQRIVEALASSRKLHWAPIHDQPASLPDGAYYATELYPRSADALADSRRSPVTVVELFEIARQVCQGLIELESTAGRPHGNLKPGNVLLRGRGRALHAFLTDPLDDQSIDRKAGAALDLKALGRLIYRLVVRADAPADVGDQLSDKPQWQALGPEGPRWRVLCAKLLTADRNGISLKQSSEEIESLRPKTGGHWKLSATMAAVIAIVVSIALIWASIQKKRNAPAYAYLNQQWDTLSLGQLQGTQQQKAQSLSLYRDLMGANDAAALDEIITSMSKLQPPRALSGYGSWHFGAYQSIRRESVQIEQIQLQISKIVENRLKDRTGLNRNDPVQVVIQLPLRLAWQDGVAKASSAEQILSTSLKKSQATDPFLIALDTAVRGDLQPKPDFADHPLDVKARLAQLKDFVGDLPRIESVLAGDYDLTAIGRQVSPRYTNGSQASQAIFASVGQWLSDAQAFALLRPDPRQPQMWASQFSSLDDRIRFLVDTSADDFSRRLTDLKATVNPWLIPPAHQSQRDQLVAEEMKYQQIFDKLRQEVEARLSDPTVLRNLLARDVARAKIERLQDFLRTQGGKLISRIDADKDAPAARQQLDSLADAVAKCAASLNADADEQHPLFVVKTNTPMLPDAQRWLKELNQIAMVRRDAMLGKSLPTDLPTTDQLKKLLDSISQDWSNWRNQTQTLVDQMARVQAPLCPAGGLYTPDESIAGQPTVQAQCAVWRADFKRWLDDLDRIDSRLSERVKADPLEKIDHSSLADWTTSSDPASAGLLLADWLAIPRQLNQDGSNQIGIDQDLAAWKSLRTFVAQMPASPRKSEIESKLSNELAQHFRKWASRAVAAADAVDDQPSLKYDCALYNLIWLTTTAPTDDPKIGKALDDLIAAADSAKQSTVSQALAAARNDRAADPQAVSGWGPGQLSSKWKMTEAGDGKVQFASTDASKTVVEFARIDSPGGSGTYLSTSEVSVGLMIRLAQGAQPQIHLSDTGKFKAWDSPTDDTVESADKWIRGVRGTALDFFKGHVSDAPSLEFPATSISSSTASQLARSINCRLPTVEDWAAALDDERKAADGNLATTPWILRGEAWANYCADLSVKLANAKGSPAETDRLSDVDPKSWQWFGSTDGRYQKIASVWDRALNGPGGAAAWNEKTILFSVEPNPAQGPRQGPGHRFYHLIGNAAEIVTAADGSSKFFVMGGSAFSPPEMPYDKPQPVTSPDDQWSDVGFRLAISAPIKPMRDRLAKLLQDPPFIPVP